MNHTQLAAKFFVLGVDIGGTTIKPKLFEIKNGIMSEDPVKEFPPLDSAKGVEPHTAQIVDVIKTASAEAKRLGGTLSGVGIGSPGRFDEKGVIKPGTNRNLGTFQGEFDGINLQEKYVAGLQKLGEPFTSLQVAVGNDANAMFAGMLEVIKKGQGIKLTNQYGTDFSQLSLYNKHAALFGIGTGIGHAIVKFDRNGDYQFVTDGHASKLRVKVDTKDWPAVEKLANIFNKPGGETKMLLFPGTHEVDAESLFCAPTINALPKILEESESDLATIENKRTLHFAGKYMARVITLIRSGKSADINPANGWTDEDKAEAQKTSVYIIGGGIGSSPIGPEVIKYAQQELGFLNQEVRLVRFPKTKESIAEREAANLVLPQVLQAQTRQPAK